MTNQEIKQVGQTIANETQVGGNTASRVGGVVEGIGVAFDNKDAANGYYQATINGGTITVNAPNYLLGNGGNLHIKMPSAGTTASTLTIGNANAVPLFYNGEAVSSNNTWEANEIISVFYDGTQFMASNSQGGGGRAVSELAENASYLWHEGDIDSITVGGVIINSNTPPKWASVTGAGSIFIPVVTGANVMLCGNGSTSSFYAFLTSSSHTVGQSPSFATGYTARRTLESNGNVILEVPSDAHYLWILKYNSQGSMMPSVRFFVQSLKDTVDNLTDEVTVMGKTKATTWNFAITPSSQKRAKDYMKYYVRKGSVLTAPTGYQFAIQFFADENSSTEWQNLYWYSSYTFDRDTYITLQARKSTDVNLSAADIAILNESTTLERYCNEDTQTTKFKVFNMARENGKMSAYVYGRELSSCTGLNDQFFELTNNTLRIQCSREFIVIYFNEHYERVNDSYSIYGEWKVNLEQDVSSLGAKYIRVMVRTAVDLDSIVASVTGCVKKDIRSADVTVSVNADTEIVALSDDATGAIQQAIFLAYLRGGKAVLYEDDYILNSTTPWIDNANAPKCCLWFNHFVDTTSQYSSPSQMMHLEGTKQPIGYSKGVRLILGSNVYNAVTNANPFSVIRSEYQSTYSVIDANGGVASVGLKNLCIILPMNDKAITSVDLRYAHCCDIQNVNLLAGYSTLEWGHDNPPPVANLECVGIRGIVGSNWNVVNTYTNVEAMGFGHAIDFSGEHLTGRNISVKYNYYGITFGVLSGVNENGYMHPIVLINVLDEHNVCLPVFSECGNRRRQMIQIFGYNLMFPAWTTQGDIAFDDARHHKCIENSNNNNEYGWGGQIFYTNIINQGTGYSTGTNNIFDFCLFEKGGKNIECVNTADYRIASDTALLECEPNFLQRVFSRTHECEAVFDGVKWVSAIGETICEYPTYVLSGVVTSGGNPVSGATITYKYRDTTVIGTTDSGGAYSITVPKFVGVIEVSKTGYTTFSRRIKITADTTLNITL